MKKNWKTTLMGVGAGLAFLFVAWYTKHDVTGADITVAMGMAGIGAASKDHDATGGTREVGS